MHAAADATVAGIFRNVLLFVTVATLFYWGVMYSAFYCPVFAIRVVFIIVAVVMHVYLLILSTFFCGNK